MSSANLKMVFELKIATQSYVHKEYSRGLKTQPWGATILRMSVDEVTWGLPVRKSRREAFNPRPLSFVTSLEGTMVLNAEL